MVKITNSNLKSNPVTGTVTLGGGVAHLESVDFCLQLSNKDLAASGLSWGAGMVEGRLFLFSLNSLLFSKLF